MLWLIIVVGILMLLSPDREGALANVLGFGLQVVITIVLFGINPILGIVAGYFFLKSWNK